MLKMKMVSTSVRTAGVVQHPAEALGDVVPQMRGRSAVARAVRRAARRGRPARPRARPARPAPPNGQAAPTANSARADRRPGELVERDEAGLQPGVGEREVVARHQHRQQRLRACCRRTPRPCRARTAPTSTTRDRRRGPVDDGQRSARPARRPARRSTHDRRSAAGPAGRPARRRSSPNSSGGSHCSSAASATRNGSCVSEATSSGPAASAMPSPRLLIHDEASSHRNPAPRRGGAATSTRRLASPRP